MNKNIDFPFLALAPPRKRGCWRSWDLLWSRCDRKFMGKGGSGQVLSLTFYDFRVFFSISVDAFWKKHISAICEEKTGHFDDISVVRSVPRWVSWPIGGTTRMGQVFKIQSWVKEVYVIYVICMIYIYNIISVKLAGFNWCHSHVCVSPHILQVTSLHAHFWQSNFH